MVDDTTLSISDEVWHPRVYHMMVERDSSVTATPYPSLFLDLRSLATFLIQTGPSVQVWFNRRKVTIPHYLRPSHRPFLQEGLNTNS